MIKYFGIAFTSILLSSTVHAASFSDLESFALLCESSDGAQHFTLAVYPKDSKIYWTEGKSSYEATAIATIVDELIQNEYGHYIKEPQLISIHFGMNYLDFTHYHPTVFLRFSSTQSDCNYTTDDTAIDYNSVEKVQP